MNPKRLAAALAAASALALPASAEAAPYQDAVLAGDPLTYLRLDEPLGAAVAEDASANDRDGAYAGAVTQGIAAPFADADTAAAIASTGSVTGSVDHVSRTLELWVNPDRVARGAQVGIASHGNPAVDGWAIGIGAKRKLAIVTAGATAQTKITLASNAWTAVAVTWSDKVRVYVNGVLKKAFNGPPPTGGGAFVLGGDGAGAFGGSFSGRLDEAALFAAALSPADIQSHFLAAHVPVNTAPPAVTGTLTVGETLTAQPGVWTDAATATRTYQWQRCDENGDDCGDIDGATATQYVLAAADECMTLQVAETVTGESGSGTTISDPTAKVGPCAAPGLDPTPDPDPTPGTDPAPTSGTGTTAGTVTTTVTATQPVVASATISRCLRLVAGRKRTKLRGYGILRLAAKKNVCLSGRIKASMKLRKGVRLKRLRYKLDGKRVRRVKRSAKFRAAAGSHKLTLRVIPRTGKAKTFKVRLRLAVS